MEFELAMLFGKMFKNSKPKKIKVFFKKVILALGSLILPIYFKLRP